MLLWCTMHVIVHVWQYQFCAYDGMGVSECVQVHTECQEKVDQRCTLGDLQLSILPPSALQRSDAIRKGMWEVCICVLYRFTCVSYMVGCSMSS